MIIINLAGETARMSFQLAQMEILGLDWERLEAVTPHTLSRPPNHEHWQRWERPMKAAEMAILESHCKAWKRVHDSGIPHLIIEDDAILAADVSPLLDRLEQESNLDHVTLEVRNRKKLIGHHHPNLPLRRLYQDRTGAAAYVLWPSGAQKLLLRAIAQPALADAVICAAYEMETWQTIPALAIQLDQCKAYGMSPPIFTTPRQEENLVRRSTNLHRIRRLLSQLRMGMRYLSKIAVSERQHVSLSSRWPDNLR